MFGKVSLRLGIITKMRSFYWHCWNPGLTGLWNLKQECKYICWHLVYPKFCVRNIRRNRRDNWSFYKKHESMSGKWKAWKSAPVLFGNRLRPFVLRIDNINIQIKKSVNIWFVSVIASIKVKQNDRIVLIKSYVPFGRRKSPFKNHFRVVG